MYFICEGEPGTATLLMTAARRGTAVFQIADWPKGRHWMVSLVERMLDLDKQSPKAKTPHEQESIQRQIAATDGQIDALVYELYGLTGEEIRIVES